MVMASLLAMERKQRNPERTAKRATAKPRMIGGYMILGDLGRGSMGRIFLARGGLDGRLYALKTPHYPAGTAERVDVLCQISFHNEVRAGSCLEHPNIVRMHTFNLRSRPPFLVMDYVPTGKTLKHYRQPNRLLPTASVMRIVPWPWATSMRKVWSIGTSNLRICY
jgi:serine/threonine protein kinase